MISLSLAQHVWSTLGRGSGRGDATVSTSKKNLWWHWFLTVLEHSVQGQIPPTRTGDLEKLWKLAYDCTLYVSDIYRKNVKGWKTIAKLGFSNIQLLQWASFLLKLMFGYFPLKRFTKPLSFSPKLTKMC